MKDFLITSGVISFNAYRIHFTKILGRRFQISCSSYLVDSLLGCSLVVFFRCYNFKMLVLANIWSLCILIPTSRDHQRFLNEATICLTQTTTSAWLLSVQISAPYCLKGGRGGGGGQLLKYLLLLPAAYSARGGYSVIYGMHDLGTWYAELQ